MYHRTGFVLATAAACAGLLGLTATAGAQTKVVYAGPPPGVGPIAAKFLPRSFAATNNPNINAFFRQRVTINVGDTVSFQLHGLHTVDLPGPSGSDLPLFAPQGLASGNKDAAGSPFWFNGKVPNFGFNPALFSSGRARTYDGTARLDSGLPLGPPKPLKVKFTRSGTFTYFCDVHRGMVGSVVVKPKHKPVPTARQDRSALIAQIIAVVKSAKRIAGQKAAADTVSLGRAGSGGVELYQMFPSTLTVSPGTTVTFTMSHNSRDFHTATFGPKSYLMALAAALRGGPTFSSIATYPSESGAAHRAESQLARQRIWQYGFPGP